MHHCPIRIVLTPFFCPLHSVPHDLFQHLHRYGFFGARLFLFKPLRKRTDLPFRVRDVFDRFCSPSRQQIILAIPPQIYSLFIYPMSLLLCTASTVSRARCLAIKSYPNSAVSFSCAAHFQSFTISQSAYFIRCLTHTFLSPPASHYSSYQHFSSTSLSSPLLFFSRHTLKTYFRIATTTAYTVFSLTPSAKNNAEPAFSSTANTLPSPLSFTISLRFL